MSDVWESVGGPFIEQATGNDRPIYVQLRQLWRVEKCRWANLVRIYQPRAIQEQIWEREEMEDSGHAEEVIESARSCTKAMEIARSVSETIEEDRVPAPPTYPTNFPSSSPPLPPRVLRKKVTFAEDIVENPPRLPGAYNRFSTRYEGGRYACPEEAGWEDTSFKNDEFYPHVYQELGEAESLAIATDAASLLVRTNDEDQTLGDDGDDDDDEEDMSSDYSESSDDSDDSSASIMSVVDAEDVAIMDDIDMNDADDEESSDDSDGTKEFVKWWLSN
ncbi:hypothetical protein BS50DRAFT_571200 [Corynespora cassiicola Philippines]|uniref:Uncharacterized protein n=1 Tax=Corynespora cassiicola Philippines TaxID=1448308 RepID=A0A2T2NWX7_CORCC|nr:hypothetical protein BS50DRAFT_571200 [Corynespora cassiicola Philippines]